MIARIKSQSIYVEDQGKAKAFYIDTLGFQLRREEAMGPGMTWLEVAPANSEACLVLYPKKMMPGSEKMLPSVILYTSDTQKTYEELSAKGVAFSMSPSKMPMGTFAKFKDLDGNEFVLSDVK
jgi:lactoylglutathione lyase